MRLKQLLSRSSNPVLDLPRTCVVLVVYGAFLA